MSEIDEDGRPQDDPQAGLAWSQSEETMELSPFTPPAGHRYKHPLNQARRYYALAYEGQEGLRIVGEKTTSLAQAESDLREFSPLSDKYYGPRFFIAYTDEPNWQRL